MKFHLKGFFLKLINSNIIKNNSLFFQVFKLKIFFANKINNFFYFLISLNNILNKGSSAA